MGNCVSANAIEDQPKTGMDAKKQLLKDEDSASSTHLMDHANSTRTREKQHLPGVNEVASDKAQSNGVESPKEASHSAEDALSAEKDAKHQKFKARGYSSGASSFSAESLGESYVFSNEGSSREEGSSLRQVDPLHLQSMRNLMHCNGDLTQAVVRLETPFGKPIEEIYDGVHDGPFLGEGVSGIVRLVKHKATGVQYACKVLDIGLINTDEGLRQLREEISIMCQLDHPNIVRIEEVYESTNTIYLLQEVCLGGDLFDRLDEQPDVHYSEAHCARLIKQMVSAVRYLHSKGVIHRDLKLENFLFSSPAADSELKMIDFGLSKHFDLGELHHEQVGTPYTCAPEILKGSYDEKSDLWSVGVITYLLLSGETPFGGCYEDDNMSAVRLSILAGKFEFEPADIWANVSGLAKEFIKRMLNVDPRMRPTAKEAQRDEWLQVYANKDGPSCEGNKLSPRIVDALVNFKEYSEMRRLLHEVLSFTLLPEQIVELRDEFQKIDSDGDGEITLSAMKDVLINSAGAGALGGLTEEEVEDIFNALRVNKNDSTIRWHEFIAAGLSQCKVDDRNLRLAFDRLDSDRKGYISFDDLNFLLGQTHQDSLQKMWAESMQQCRKNDDGTISYDDFLMLMKGQTRRESHRASMVWSPQNAAQLLADIGDFDDEMGASLIRKTSRRVRAPSAILEEDESSKSPTPEKDTGRNKYFRKRSKSFDDISSVDSSPSSTSRSRRISFPPRVRPSLAADGDLITLISNQAKAPLLATREEYVKHRGLRLALCEASKDFDMKCQARRASVEGREVLATIQGAGLIMKRGSQTPKSVEYAHQRALFDAAVRRGGRGCLDRHAKNCHRRKRTQSDITGMLADS